MKEARQLPNVANLLNDSDQSSENLDHIVSLAEKGDEATIELIERIGENIGIGLSNLIHTLNPELVIIGGKITKFTKWIKRPIDQAIKKRAKLYYENNIKIKYSQLGDDSIILGAAHIGISQLFKETKVTIN